MNSNDIFFIVAIVALLLALLLPDFIDWIKYRFFNKL